MTEQEPNPLQKAAQLFSVRQQQVRELEAHQSAFEADQRSLLTGLVRNVVMSSVEARMALEAAKGKDQLVVMRLATAKTKREIGEIDHYYDSEDPVYRDAFDQVFQGCQDRNLNPKRVKIDSHYGEPLDSPMEEIVISW